MEVGRVELHKPVQNAVILYALLGVLDLFFTLLALSSGIREGNPILAWFHGQGLFLYAKVAATILVVSVGNLLWNLPVVRKVVAGGNAVMLFILAVHVTFWAQHWPTMPSFR